MYEFHHSLPSLHPPSSKAASPDLSLPLYPEHYFSSPRFLQPCSILFFLSSLLSSFFLSFLSSLSSFLPSSPPFRPFFLPLLPFVRSSFLSSLSSVLPSSPPLLPSLCFFAAHQLCLQYRAYMSSSPSVSHLLTLPYLSHVLFYTDSFRSPLPPTSLSPFSLKILLFSKIDIRDGYSPFCQELISSLHEERRGDVEREKGHDGKGFGSSTL